MPMRWTRWGLLGQDVYDADGTPVGRVVDGYPFDGGTVEMAVVARGQFGTKWLLSLHNAGSATSACERRTRGGRSRLAHAERRPLRRR